MAKKSQNSGSSEAVDTGSYEHLLGLGWDEIPAEQLLPDGHWRLKVSGITFKPGNEKIGARLNVAYDPVAPLDDVSSAALEEMGDYDFTSNRMFAPLFIATTRELRQAVETLKRHAGFNPPAGEPLLIADGDTFKVNPKIKDALIGSEVVGMVSRNSYTNREGNQVVDNRVGGFVSPDAM